jgi:glycosyltransferase involved in cell wall biosynthesis
LHAADLVLAITDDDRRRMLNEVPSARVTTIPAGVDTVAFPFSPSAGAAPSLVWVGGFDWLPNADAVQWFAQSMMPAIMAAVPEIVLHVVGRAPTPAIRSFEGPHFKVHGEVEDVRPFITNATISVVPLRVGGGMRLKILEFFALGTPVVSTTVGAEGIDVKQDADIILADQADEFVNGIVQLIRDPQRRVRQALAARTLVETHYSWEAVGVALHNAYTSLSIPLR